MKRTLIILALTFGSPLFSHLYADDEPIIPKKIPIEETSRPELIRSQINVPIVAFYLEDRLCLHTTVFENLGDIDMTVTNMWTGESWYDSFDSSVISQFVMQISEIPGIYEIVYMTEAGYIYKGTFNL